VVRWRPPIVVLVPLVVACGRLGYDPVADGSATPDSQPPFGAATLVPLAPDVHDPALTGDLLRIVFASGDDLYTSTRPAPDRSWLDPTPIVPLNTPAIETAPGMSLDGLSLYFSSNRAPAVGSRDLWLSDRARITDAWGAPVHFVDASSAGLDTGPQPAASGLLLVLDRDRDLYVSARTSPSGAWPAPEPMEELNTPFEEADPMLARGGLSIVFASNRPGGPGGRDLYRADRRSLSEPFDAPEPIDALNSPAQDGDPWVSEDLQRIFFVSDRSGASQLYDSGP